MDKENPSIIDEELEEVEEVKILTEEEVEALTEQEREAYVLAVATSVMKKYRRAFEELAKY